jgi:membrane fusion protein (multidrug efflux system)
MKKKRSIWIDFLVLCVVSGCLYAGWHLLLRPGNTTFEIPVTEDSRQAAWPETIREEVKAVNVVIWEAVPGNVEETFTLPGTLEAWENLTLSLEQSGPITWVGPKEGDSLKAGQPILKIDTRLLETEHARNNMEYDLKVKQLERVEKLFEKQLVSQREYDIVKNDFDTASTNLEQSSIALEKSTLTSPVDGILEQLLVDRGEYGHAGMPAAVVVQVDRLKVLVDVPEKDVTAVRVGQGVTVLPADLDGNGVVGRDGKVIQVDFLADELTRTYQTKIEIDNRGGFLRPGMIVRVRCVRRLLEDVLVVPLYAVLDRDGEKYVFVVEDGTAVQRQVRLGPVIDGKVVLFGGLQVGEDLIIKGHQLVSDGGPVNVVEDQGKEG